jgi:hypothetical protein
MRIVAGEKRSDAPKPFGSSAEYGVSSRTRTSEEKAAMAEMKTKATDKSPAAFMKEIEDPQARKDCQEISKLMEKITGKPAIMWGNIVGFGKYHYTYATGKPGECLMTGFAPRKGNVTLYLGPGLEDEALMSKLGKYKNGKGCLHIKNLDDIDRDVLRKLITKSVAEMKKRYSCD